jgi:UDP-3-O-[3-hydroxymyristoyl] glucosamine N-acyltransferase
MPKQFTLAELAEKCSVTYEGDPLVSIFGVATLHNAKAGELSFLFNTRYQKHLKTTEASIVVLDEAHKADCNTNRLITPEPYFVFAQIAALFDKTQEVNPGLDPSFKQGADCRIPASSTIGANVVFGHRVTLGQNVVIHPNVVIQDDVILGDNCVVWPNVTICHGTHIGSDCEFLSGAVIGSDGFGFAMHEGHWHKVPQLGNVIIGNRVSVGANTSIDRGSIDDTIIAEGVKLDNQVQVAHNVQLGKHTVMAGCAGVAGSTKVGDYCQIGGGAGLTGHIEVADQVAISAMSMVPKSITEPGVYSGRDMGLLPLSEWQKKTALLRQTDKWVAKIKQLENEVAACKAAMQKTSSTQNKAARHISVENNEEQNNMSKNLDVNDILQLIPHRYPFLLVDKVIDYQAGESIVAIKNVTINEQFFVGHFPQRPVMPGVLIVEALAQAGAVLAFKTVQDLNLDDDAEILFLAGMDKVRFKRVVEPGDQLRLEVKVLKSKGRIWKLQGAATVNGELACTAEILSAK